MKHCPRAVSIARPSTLQPTALPSELAATPAGGSGKTLNVFCFQTDKWPTIHRNQATSPPAQDLPPGCQIWIMVKFTKAVIFQAVLPAHLQYCTGPGRLEPVGHNKIFVVDIYHLALKLLYTHTHKMVSFWICMNW